MIAGLQNRVYQGLFRAALCTASLTIASCGGGGHASSASAQTGGAGLIPALPSTTMPQIADANLPAMSTRPVAVRMTYHLPVGAQAAVSGRSSSAVRRGTQYIATSNTQISIDVTPIGGSATTFGPSACTSGSCVISFTANPGPNTIAFTLSDGSNVLSTFSTTTIIQPTAMNTLNFTANPVVSSVSLQLGSAAVNAGTAFDDVLTVNAADAAGNIIVGSGEYVDVNGKPVSLYFSVRNNTAGGKGSVSIKGATRLSAPGQGLTYAHYDGNWLDSSDIAVQSSSRAITNLTGATLTTIPRVVTEYTVPTLNSQPIEIRNGPDGNLWFLETNKNRVGKLTLDGNFMEYVLPTTNSQPTGFTLGPDGNFWFTEYNKTKIGRIATDGSILEFPIGSKFVSFITPGPDGNLWYGDQFSVSLGRITTKGIRTNFSVPPGEKPFGVTAGPDGNMWYTLTQGGNKIGRMSIYGDFTEFSIPTAPSEPEDIITGPDGNLWFTEYAGSKIGRITTDGNISEFVVPTTNSNPADIRVGPDGNLWFTEYSGNKIGRITPGGTFTEYTVPTAASGPASILLGPDGNLWITELNKNKIAKFVL